MYEHALKLGTHLSLLPHLFPRQGFKTGHLIAAHTKILININKLYSPVEFGRNLGRPRKNLYKDISYTVGKIILSAFQW